MYTTNIEKITFNLGVELVNMLNVEKATSILDCGCGSGLLAIEMIRRKADGAKSCGSDLTESMLNRAKYRTKTFLSNPLSNKYITMEGYDEKVITEDIELFKTVDHSYHMANNETLECFADG